MTRYQQVRAEVDRAYGRYEAQVEALAQLQTIVTGLEDVLNLQTLTGTALQTLLSLVSQEELGEIERLVTYGLQAVFEDQSLTFRLEIETKRNVQTATPKLRQGEVEAEVLDAFGGGPASLVAFLLRLLVVRRFGLAPLIVLDEVFAMVSLQYVPAVAHLLRSLAKTLDFRILLVTHQPEFCQYADVVYEAVERVPGETVFERR